MLRLHSARVAVVATTLALRRTSAACGAPRASLRSLTADAAVSPAILSASTAARRFFVARGPSQIQAARHSLSSPPTAFPSAVTDASSAGFLRGARVSAAGITMPVFATQGLQRRAFRVKGKDRASAPEQEGEADATQQQQQKSGEEAKKEQPEQEESGDEKAKTEGESTAEENGGKGGANGKKGKAAPKKKKSFMDHINGLREDYAKFPDIYNSANAINFVVFTVFCLCSTGSTTEENWWMTQWGLDNSFRPWTWFLHSFLTNNFLSMTYAMMLLHTMCHHVLPTLGSRGLMMYVGSTAVISGAIMWLGNYLYYGGAAAPEKQFGPWDVVGALFVMEYFYYGLTPLTILNSFSGWIKYAVWVGEVCILYFDWQPTVVGTVVGLALCRGVPRFRAMKPAATGAM
ncbi:putative mitochondrial hypothetical protein [Leptomonas pyrrhocoris]|uniref:Uncharacterized protein n=1 Tax=Leptomonas pyrrhocoris TaxID=157538 RepID=A0A0N0DSH1_LEPPY|nr:putative mitochondrial hypothetical protein [Leptomonas pyrrhocoris]XP_015654430.1 putative mitochondrial hypothetical protein [Leptomonas pyrrhocoris]KPA75990.1 putative mitochondrial hypothetical protein [Leptomonas pyrrhocoris]KPA75991.1 putative mitochondrial hypothetical protein [Leptomonas pyrrhocoris]|eukprot:XP_015654429.1 putative mitochondrial hypothetical protein [Leptomonas pyrrhocoris]